MKGCTRVSSGCDHCYAVGRTHRLGSIAKTRAKYGGLTVLNRKGDRHFNGVVRCHEDALDIPLKSRKPTVYFVNSMSDLFHPGIPDEFIVKVRAVMALCPRHTFQVLTKRPERMAEIDNDPKLPNLIYRQIQAWLDEGVSGFFKTSRQWDSAHKLCEWRASGGTIDECEWTWPLPNEWKGTSCENQKTADERILHLLKCPAAVLFISAEPLLGPVEIPSSYLLGVYNNGNWPMGGPPFESGSKIDWVIVGGESGPNARPCNIEWIRSIIEQCKAADVPVFVKQLGKLATIGHDNPPPWIKATLKHPKGGDPSEWPEDLRIRQMPVREQLHAV